MNQSWIDVWYQAALQNTWVREAHAKDPLLKDDFYECNGLDELFKWVKSRQSTGSAFYYDDICFINVGMEGDGFDWMVLKQGDVYLEYYTPPRNMDKYDFYRLIQRIETETLEEFWR
ncbi:MULTISPECIES: hypothetical protein [Thermoactinomyces]|uniref:Uncharacterized protein n=1 Tax=Thermoactinomyces daqus TaxID=1329516 RepID=A0A7W2AIQ0_9BACL|nr:MULTISPECIES: hypothetical protein [Thermoactinomyces]MBA4543976.1 hypothetical protein [Thermoactinomyces daqus]MBH8599091.1 hypothetical protein [Thermoactinomyces sp. CICC 10523]MBH8607978.1 hypothetical protein [Thermoactinomyces sp. CICC 10521]